VFNIDKYNSWSWSEMIEYKKIMTKIYRRCSREAFVKNFAKNKN